MKSKSSIRELITYWKNRKTPTSQQTPYLTYWVRTTQMKNGFQCFLIQHRTSHSVPFAVMNYLTAKAPIRSPATVRSAAYGLTYLYTFAEVHGIDLEREILAGRGLDLKLLPSLRDFVRTRGNSTVKVLPSARGNKKLNSLQEANRILDLAARYLRWSYLQFSPAPETQAKLLEKHLEGVRYSLRRNEPLRVLPEATIAMLDQAFNPETSKIWRNPIDRVRNYCIYQIAKETGARISEILGLYVDDISTGQESFIRICKRDNNPADTRRKKARAKTFGRSIPISNGLRSRLSQYAGSRPAGTKTPFLFLSHFGPTMGKPMSLNRADELLSDVAEHVNSVDSQKRTSWHDMRHTALYRFYWALRGLPNQKDLLKQIAGHLSDSSFQLYHRLALMEDAQGLLAELHRNPANRKVTAQTQTETLEDLLSISKSGSSYD